MFPLFEPEHEIHLLTDRPVFTEGVGLDSRAAQGVGRPDLSVLVLRQLHRAVLQNRKTDRRRQNVKI